MSRDAAAVDDVNRRGSSRRIAVDPVTRPADHRLDRGVERDERAQRAVRQAVARRARREDLAHQRNLQQRLVRARDADGHGLRLVLDGVDRARELLDRLRERGGEVLDDRARRADLAEVDLVRVERHDTDRVPQERRELHRGAGFERAVVVAGAQAVEEPRGQRLELTRERRQRIEVASDGAGAARRSASRCSRARRAAGAPTRRSRAPLRSRTGGRRARTARTRAPDARPAPRSSRPKPSRSATRRRRRSRSAPPCARGRSRPPWRRRRRSIRAARPRTR